MVSDIFCYNSTCTVPEYIKKNTLLFRQLILMMFSKFAMTLKVAETHV